MEAFLPLHGSSFPVLFLIPLCLEKLVTPQNLGLHSLKVGGVQGAEGGGLSYTPIVATARDLIYAKQVGMLPTYPHFHLQTPHFGGDWLGRWRQVYDALALMWLNDRFISRGTHALSYEQLLADQGAIWGIHPADLPSREKEHDVNMHCAT